LEVSKRVLGEEHSNTLMSMNNLAATLSDQGDLAGARKLETKRVGTVELAATPHAAS
jgi:hypothetical protein